MDLHQGRAPTSRRWSPDARWRGAALPKHPWRVFPPLPQLHLQLAAQGFKYSNRVISLVSHQQSDTSCTLWSRQLYSLRSKILCFLDTREFSQLELRLSLKRWLFTAAPLVTVQAYSGFTG